MNLIHMSLSKASKNWSCHRAVSYTHLNSTVWVGKAYSWQFSKHHCNSQGQNTEGGQAHPPYLPRLYYPTQTLIDFLVERTLSHYQIKIIINAVNNFILFVIYVLTETTYNLSNEPNLDLFRLLGNEEKMLYKINNFLSNTDNNV